MKIWSCRDLIFTVYNWLSVQENDVLGAKALVDSEYCEAASPGELASL